MPGDTESTIDELVVNVVQIWGKGEAKDIDIQYIVYM